MDLLLVSVDKSASYINLMEWIESRTASNGFDKSINIEALNDVLFVINVLL